MGDSIASLLRPWAEFLVFPSPELEPVLDPISEPFLEPFCDPASFGQKDMCEW